MLGYTKFQTANNTQYGEFTVFSGAEILGKSGVADYFYTFWKALERPGRKDIKPGELSRYLDRLVILDVLRHEDGFGLNVRLIGTFVANYYGEISGQDIHAMGNKQASARIYSLCAMVLERSEPLMTVTPAFAEDKQYLEAFALYMPLFDDAGSIDKILVSVDIASLHHDSAEQTIASANNLK